METQTKTAQELKKTLNELHTMTDEIRVQLHLAGMDAKDKWARDLEPRLFAFEKRVQSELSAATKMAANDLREALHNFRASLNNVL